MKFRKIEVPKINLNVPAGTTPLTMDLEKFFEFNFWMAEELLDLESRFAQWQAPALRATNAENASTARSAKHKPTKK